MLEMLHIRSDEPRGVRLFSLAVDRAELDRLQAILAEAEPGLAEGRLADLLGVKAVDATRVEVFDLTDLDDFGLMNYLIKANGLPEEALEPDRAALDALSGVVMILYPNAFHRQELTLTPAPALTPVGAWDEDIPEIEFTPLRSEAAQGQLDDFVTAPAPQLPRWLWWGASALLIVAVLAVLAALQGGP